MSTPKSQIFNSSNIPNIVSQELSKIRAESNPNNIKTKISNLINNTRSTPIRKTSSIPLKNLITNTETSTNSSKKIQTETRNLEHDNIRVSPYVSILGNNIANFPPQQTTYISNMNYDSQIRNNSLGYQTRTAKTSSQRVIPKNASEVSTGVKLLRVSNYSNNGRKVYSNRYIGNPVIRKDDNQRGNVSIQGETKYLNTLRIEGNRTPRALNYSSFSGYNSLTQSNYSSNYNRKESYNQNGHYEFFKKRHETLKNVRKPSFNESKASLKKIKPPVPKLVSKIEKMEKEKENEEVNGNKKRRIKEFDIEGAIDRIINKTFYNKQ